MIYHHTYLNISRQSFLPIDTGYRLNYIASHIDNAIYNTCVWIETSELSPDIDKTILYTSGHGWGIFCLEEIG